MRKPKFEPALREIKVGQIWLDRDKRTHERLLTVERLSEEHAYMRRGNWPRLTRIRLTRLRKFFELRSDK